MRISLGAKIALYAFLIIMVFITLIPLLYTVSASFKTNYEITAGGINLIPCSISSVESTNNYQPTPLRGEAADAVIRCYKRYSAFQRR